MQVENSLRSCLAAGKGAGASRGCGNLVMNSVSGDANCTVSGLKSGTGRDEDMDSLTPATATRITLVIHAGTTVCPEFLECVDAVVEVPFSP